MNSDNTTYQIKFDILLFKFGIIPNIFKLKLVRQNAIIHDYINKIFCNCNICHKPFINYNITNNINCWECKYKLSIIYLWKWNFNRFLNNYKSIFIKKIFQNNNIYGYIPEYIINYIIQLSLYYYTF